MTAHGTWRVGLALALALLAVSPAARAEPPACPSPDKLVAVARKAYRLDKSDRVQLLACTSGNFPRSGYFAVFQVRSDGRPDVHSGFFARNGTLVRDDHEPGTIYQKVTLSPVPGEQKDDVIEVAEENMWSGVATEIRRMSASDSMMSTATYRGFRRESLGYECRASWSLSEPDAHGVRHLEFDVKNLTPQVDPKAVYVPCDEQRVVRAVGQAHCIRGATPALCLLHGSDVHDLPYGRAITVVAGDGSVVQLVQLTETPITCDEEPVTVKRTDVYIVTFPGQRPFAAIDYPQLRVSLRRSETRIQLTLGKTEVSGRVTVRSPQPDGPTYEVSGSFKAPICPRKDPLPTIFAGEFTVVP